MELLLILIGGALVLAIALGAGWLVLLKLGVIAHYALKPDRPEDKVGDYGLDQSRSPDDRGAPGIQVD